MKARMRASSSSALQAGATPSACACLPTASATLADTSRRSFTGGSSRAVRSVRVGDSVASAFAEAMNMVSVMRVAAEASTPRPTPGKM